MQVNISHFLFLLGWERCRKVFFKLLFGSVSVSLRCLSVLWLSLQRHATPLPAYIPTNPSNNLLFFFTFVITTNFKLDWNVLSTGFVTLTLYLYLCLCLCLCLSLHWMKMGVHVSVDVLSAGFATLAWATAIVKPVQSHPFQHLLEDLFNFFSSTKLESSLQIKSSKCTQCVLNTIYPSYEMQTKIPLGSILLFSRNIFGSWLFCGSWGCLVMRNNRQKYSRDERVKPGQ